ncbi:MAG: hypothetical protein AB8F26_06590 [Phycisphaerales bacterium]
MSDHIAAEPLSFGNCFRCDYDLTSLSPEQNCPECGLPIEASLGRIQLAKAPPEYLAKLHKGVFIIQAAIICVILLFFAGMFAGMTFASSPNGVIPRPIDISLGVLAVVLAFALLVGWWMFSEPHPEYEGTYNGSDMRRTVRVLLVVAAGLAAVDLVLSVLPASVAIGLVVMVLGVVAIIVSVARYFTQMLYIRWMAPMLSNRKVYNRAKLLMWLGPVLMTVGILLLGLGPLIALVLYWNMLDWIRKDLKAIRADRQDFAETA